MGSLAPRFLDANVAREYQAAGSLGSLSQGTGAAPAPTNTAPAVTVTPTVTAGPITVTPTVTAVPVTVTPTVTGAPATVTSTRVAPPVTVTPTETAVPVTVTPTSTAVPVTVTDTETATTTVTGTETAVPVTVTPTSTAVPVTVTPTNTAVPVTVTPTVTAAPVTVTPTERAPAETTTPTVTAAPVTTTTTSTEVVRVTTTRTVTPMPEPVPGDSAGVDLALFQSIRGLGVNQGDELSHDGKISVGELVEYRVSLDSIFANYGDGLKDVRVEIGLDPSQQLVVANSNGNCITNSTEMLSQNWIVDLSCPISQDQNLTFAAVSSAAGGEIVQVEVRVIGEDRAGYPIRVRSYQTNIDGLMSDDTVTEGQSPFTRLLQYRVD